MNTRCKYFLILGYNLFKAIAARWKAKSSQYLQVGQSWLQGADHLVGESCCKSCQQLNEILSTVSMNYQSPTSISNFELLIQTWVTCGSDWPRGLPSLSVPSFFLPSSSLCFHHLIIVSWSPLRLSLVADLESTPNWLRVLRWQYWTWCAYCLFFLHVLTMVRFTDSVIAWLITPNSSDSVFDHNSSTIVFFFLDAVHVHSHLFSSCWPKKHKSLLFQFLYTQIFRLCLQPQFCDNSFFS